MSSPALDRPHHPARIATAAAFVLATLGASIACNSERKAECDRFVEAMKPLDEGVPSPDAVERVQKSVEGLKLEDQPLGVYAKNYAATLTVLSSTLKLKATGAAPDGTDDVIKEKLKEARTDKADTERYCSR
jgi:hypothetical protein